MKTLYQAIIEAGIECSNWCTDLYVPNIQAVKDILNLPEYEIHKKNSVYFTAQYEWNSSSSKSSIEIPFAFDPAWSK